MKKCLTRTAVVLFFISVLTTLPAVAATDFEDLFGTEGYFHPFITIDQSWSDNIFLTENEKTSDYWIKTSPGFWLAFPGSDVRNPAADELSNFQAILSYNPDFINYASENYHDHTDHNLDGYLYFGGSGGLSLEITDKYRHTHDDIVEDQSNIRYTDNTLSNDLRYELSEKLTIGLNYTWFTEDYEKIKNIKDRTDNQYTTSFYYTIFSKTDLFFEFGFKDIKYDIDPASNSDETEYMVGIKWDVTDKSTGKFSVGYQDKSFDVNEGDDESILKLILDANYNLSDKTNVSVTIRNETNESDELGATFIQTTSLLSTLRHDITERVSGYLSLFYNIEDYNIDREDKTFNLAPSVKYEYNEIFSCDFAYTYEDVESKGLFSSDSYTANTLLLSATATF